MVHRFRYITNHFFFILLQTFCCFDCAPSRIYMYIYNIPMDIVCFFRFFLCLYIAIALLLTFGFLFENEKKNNKMLLAYEAAYVVRTVVRVYFCYMYSFSCVFTYCINRRSEGVLLCFFVYYCIFVFILRVTADGVEVYFFSLLTVFLRHFQVFFCILKKNVGFVLIEMIREFVFS